MNVIVCVKQVPNTTQIRIDPEKNTLIREGVESIINPYDMHAVEEGLRLKEKTGGTVTTISMGPPQAEEALRDTICLGADDAILLTDRSFAGADTLATSYTLAKAIEKISDYDLIICGKQALDGDTAQVGPEIADKLGIPYVSFVKEIEEISDGKLIVHRVMDNGYDVVELPLPGLITVVKEINEPRIASLKGRMKAKKAEIPHWSAEDINATEDRIGLQGSPTWVTAIFTPKPRGKREILQGTLDEKLETLIQKLSDTGGLAR